MLHLAGTTGLQDAIAKSFPAIEISRESRAGSEHEEFLKRQLITYLGNKRALLEPIESAIQEVRRLLGGRRLCTLDAFSGSGVVSRLMKQHSHTQIANDMESYARVISECYLTNAAVAAREPLRAIIADLNAHADAQADTQADEPFGFIEELYAPRDESSITSQDRVFYSRQNARRLDVYAQRISELDPAIRPLLLGPLLSSASVHANTSGVFKGFYKGRNGVGRFGGSGGDALDRILGKVRLFAPVLSSFESEFRVLQAEAQALPNLVGHIDLAYLDPPYNQHPYGSNYFMLNLLVCYRRPAQVSRVSGIPPDWQRSPFNRRADAFSAFRTLATNLDAKFLLVSYNDEGFIPTAVMADFLSSIGRVQMIKIAYSTFRGSRNLSSRNLKVTEHLYLVERT